MNVSQTSQYKQEGKQKVVTSRCMYNPLKDKIMILRTATQKILCMEATTCKIRTLGVLCYISQNYPMLFLYEINILSITCSLSSCYKCKNPIWSDPQIKGHNYCDQKTKI